MNFLQRIKVLDEDGKASITNISVYLVLALVSFVTIRTGTIDPTSLGALFTALGSYRVKLFQAEKTETRISDVEGLKSEISKLTSENTALKRAIDSAELKAPKAPRGVLPKGLMP